jgi:predicted HD superfamily hydrolase involved in NAD metabolism
VESVAFDLAAHWGADVKRAARAGLLHDCAKGLSLEALQRLVIEGNLRLDKDVWDSRALLHAPVGAYLARRDHGETDSQVLDAIRWHTTGRPGMSAQEAIIYLADMIEPGRGDLDDLPAIRALAWTDLDAAMRLALRSTVAYIERKRRAVHADTLDALHWYEGKRS